MGPPSRPYLNLNTPRRPHLLMSHRDSDSLTYKFGGAQTLCVRWGWGGAAGSRKFSVRATCSLRGEGSVPEPFGSAGGKAAPATGAVSLHGSPRPEGAPGVFGERVCARKGQRRNPQGAGQEPGAAGPQGGSAGAEEGRMLRLQCLERKGLLGGLTSPAALVLGTQGHRWVALVK